MNKLIKCLPLVLISQISLLAQSKEECIEYITQELRSYETFHYFIKEMSFSKEGDVFNLLRRKTGARDKWLVLPLKDVDIYCVTHNPTRGVTYYNLMVRARGRKGFFESNGLQVQGDRPILTGIENKLQAESLAKAFERLTFLTTGRKNPFVDK